MTNRPGLRIPFEVKAADDAALTFEGLLSAWTIDYGYDRVHRGAFTRTLDHWKSSGRKRTIPLIDLHGYDSITRVVGKLLDAEETDEGLWTKWDFIADDEDAAKAYRRVKGGYIRELSMGYEAVRYDYADQELDGGRTIRIRNLYEVKLGEGSLVIWAMQPNAVIDLASVKSAINAGTLTDEQKNEIRALLETPALPPAAKGLAPDDARRLGVESLLRDVTLRSLATRC